MTDDTTNPFGKVAAKAWSDADFKQRLLTDPRAALAELGVKPPQGTENVTLKVVENTADIVFLVLPAAPAEGELKDAALDGVAGGAQMKWFRT